MAAEVAHHEGGGHRWTVITTNNPDPRVRERIAFIDADELTALIARVATAEKAIREVLQAKRGLQITYCDEVNARMEAARKAVEAEERAEQAEASVARVRQLHTSFSRRDGVPYCDHCSVSAGSPWRRYVLVPWPCGTLAALDPQEADRG